MSEIVVDLLYGKTEPCFGDLVELCGYMHPIFKPSGHFSLGDFKHLQFSQVDDYFGIPIVSYQSIAIWLYPLIQGAVVAHHPGPFHAVRLSYVMVHDNPRRFEHFLTAISCLSSQHVVEVILRNTESAGLGVPPVCESIIEYRNQLVSDD